MQNKSFYFFTLTVVLMLLEPCRGRDARPFCLRSSPTDGAQTLVTFLTEDLGSLCLSIWYQDVLVKCEVVSDPAVTENYRTFCDMNGGGEDADLTIITQLLSADTPCTVSSGESSVSMEAAGPRLSGRPRGKRALTVPGTRWCGTGTNALDYEDLGMFDSADRCCRDHDHCLHNIPAFTMRFGVFNSNFFTVSHCGCDQRFEKCLLGVNDSVASMVGYGFFNILKVPCFELEQRPCNTKSWWGTCGDVQEVPQAVFRSNPAFNSTVEDDNHSEDNNHNSLSVHEQSVTERPNVNMQTKSHSRKSKCNQRQTTRGDTFQKTKRKECKEESRENQESGDPSHGTNVTRVNDVETTSRKHHPKMTASTPTVTQQQTPKRHSTTTHTPVTATIQSKTKQGPKWTTAIPTSAQPTTQNTTLKMEKGTNQRINTTVMPRNTDPHNLTHIHHPCQSLKHLDECRYRILALEEKYELQNTETKMVFHCACTRRLAAEIEHLKHPSVLPSLLKEFVSMHCFKLGKKKKCNKRKSCAGGFVKAYDLLQALKKMEEKNTAGATSLRKRRKRGTPVRLSKRCLRLEREKERLTRLL